MANHKERMKMIDDMAELKRSFLKETPTHVFSFPWVINNIQDVMKSPTLINQQRLSVNTEEINRSWDINMVASEPFGTVEICCRARECHTPIRVSLQVILPMVIMDGWVRETPIEELTDKDKLLEIKVRFMGDLIPYLYKPEKYNTITIKLWIFKALPDRQLGSLEQLANDMASLYKTGSSSTDFKIVTGDNDKGFLVHKMVLSARSPVFAAMIQSNYKEGKSGVVRVPDITSDTMELLLEYVYTGNIKQVSTLQPNNIIDLAYAADKYALVYLLEYCDEALADKVNNDNAAELVTMADKLNLTRASSVIKKCTFK